MVGGGIHTHTPHHTTPHHQTNNKKTRLRLAHHGDDEGLGARRLAVEHVPRRGALDHQLLVYLSGWCVCVCCVCGCGWVDYELLGLVCVGGGHQLLVYRIGVCLVCVWCVGGKSRAVGFIGVGWGVWGGGGWVNQLLVYLFIGLGCVGCGWGCGRVGVGGEGGGGGRATTSIHPMAHMHPCTPVGKSA